MSTEFVYCPVIKGKVNDIKAVSLVSPAFSTQIRPLFELPPFKPTDDPGKVLAKFSLRLRKLNGDRRAYVDFPLLRPGSTVDGGEPALSVAYGQLNMLHVPFEPVYGFDRDDRLWGLVLNQASRSGGLLLRLVNDDLDFPRDTIDKIVDLIAHGLDPSSLDVMIDWRALVDSDQTMLAASATADFVDNLCRAIRVRRILLAGSCAPKNVSLVERDSHGIVHRHELDLWAHVASERLPIQPIFSDYGVIHPDFSDLTVSTHINGKIRYTAGAEIHIHRGHSLRQFDKFEQYRTLASDVMRSVYYKGNSFSYGDRYVYECATGHAGTGNAGTWVLVDQNHHVTLTATQFQRLARSAATGSSADHLLAQI